MTADPRDMVQRLRSHDDGFTLIELLVVILIVGILAAIALPTFLGQQKKGQDTSAKSNARNLVTHVESCYADAQTYATCNDAGLGTDTGLPLGAGAEKVTVAAVSATSYTVTATSKTLNTFSITRAATGAITRTCVATVSGGGCKGGTW